MINFNRYDDPLNALRIGKTALIENWLNEMGIEFYDINEDYTISIIRQSVDLSFKNLIELPEYIKFDIISGNFTCSNNKLITLKGGPRVIIGNYVCRDNQLTSLEYGPSYVAKDYFSYNNKNEFSYCDILKYCQVNGSIYP